MNKNQTELKSKVQDIVVSLNKFQVSSFITNSMTSLFGVLIYFIRYSQVLLQCPIYLSNTKTVVHSYTQNKKKLPLLLMTNSRAHLCVCVVIAIIDINIFIGNSTSNF